MPIVEKEKTIIKGFGNAVLLNEVKHRENDPVMIKKVEKASETLKRVGMPEMKKKSTR